MEDKIFDAFDSIELDKNIKNNALNNVIMKKEKHINYHIYKKLMYSVLVLGVFILTIVINGKNNLNDNLDSEFNINGGKETINDVLVYQNNSYYLTDENASDFAIHNEIGKLDNFIVSNDLKEEDDTDYGNDAIIYSSNDENVLLVKISEQIMVYRKTNR